MRNLYFLIALSVLLCASAVLMTWLWFFHDYEISKHGSDWANFATYFGSFMTPSVALLSLFAFLRTLAQQQQQIDSLEAQSRQGVLFRIIEQLERDYLTHMDSFVFYGTDSSVNSALKALSDPLLEPQQVALPFRPTRKDRMDASAAEKRLYADIEKGTHRLELLQQYVTEHDSLGRDDSLTRVYRMRHELAIRRLARAGWLRWNEWAIAEP